MNRWNIAFCSVALAMMSLLQTTIAQEDIAIEVSTSQERTEYGAPVVLRLTLKFQQPRVSQQTGSPLRNVKLDGLRLHVQRNTDEIRLFPFRLPVTFTVHDVAGLEYTTDVVMFCDLYEKKGKLIKQMIFPKPRTYDISIIRSENVVSNRLRIVMQPSKTGDKALSVLIDARDFAFLLGGVYKSQETISHLEELISQLPEKLDELVKTGYVKTLASDPFSGKPFVYRPTGENFTLYSFGPNFQDDGGKVGLDTKGQPKKWVDNGDWVFWPVSSGQETTPGATGTESTGLGQMADKQGAVQKPEQRQPRSPQPTRSTPRR